MFHLTRVHFTRVKYNKRHKSRTVKLAKSTEAKGNLNSENVKLSFGYDMYSQFLSLL